MYRQQYIYYVWSSYFVVVLVILLAISNSTRYENRISHECIFTPALQNQRSMHVLRSIMMSSSIKFRMLIVVCRRRRRRRRLY